jgi:hypothetical protein
MISSVENRFWEGQNSFCTTRKSTRQADSSAKTRTMARFSWLLSRIGWLQSVAVVFLAVRISLTVHEDRRHGPIVDCSCVSAHKQLVSFKLQVGALGAPAIQVNCSSCQYNPKGSRSPCLPHKEESSLVLQVLSNLEPRQKERGRRAAQQ